MKIIIEMDIDERHYSTLSYVFTCFENACNVNGIDYTLKSDDEWFNAKFGFEKHLE